MCAHAASRRYLSWGACRGGGTRRCAAGRGRGRAGRPVGRRRLCGDRGCRCIRRRHLHRPGHHQPGPLHQDRSTGQREVLGARRWSTRPGTTAWTSSALLPTNGASTETTPAEPSGRDSTGLNSRFSSSHVDAVRIFFTIISRALACGSRQARGRARARTGELWTRSTGDGSGGQCERDHQGQGPGMEWAGACPRPGRRLRPRPLVRGHTGRGGPTLDCALPRQTHWHLSGWTGQTCGWAMGLGTWREVA